MKKKRLFFISIILVLVLLSGCNFRRKLIKKINLISKKESNFISISVLKIDQGMRGILANKEGKRVLSIIFFIPNSNILDINCNQTEQLINSSKYASLNYNIKRYSKNNYKFKKFIYEKNEIKKEQGRYKIPYTKILEKETSWGEGSLKGVNIPRNKLNKVRITKSKVNNNWKVLTANYNLKKETPTLVGYKGEFKLWYNQENKTVLEFYEQQSKKNISIRRIWFGETISLKPQKLKRKKLLNIFFRYYKKANFKKFVEAEALKK